MSFIIIEDKNEWNSKVLEKNGSFLQSWEWGEFQKTLGREIWRISENNSNFLAQIIKHPIPLNYSFLYSPRGPLGNFSAPNWKNFLDFIKPITKEKKAIFLRIEPEILETEGPKKFLSSLNIKKSLLNVQPKTTRLIDLSKNETELLDEMEHDTRYSIKSSQKRGVVIKIAETTEEKKEIINAFKNLLETTAKKHNFKTYPFSYYEKVSDITGNLKIKLISAKFNQQIISAAFFAFFGKNAYYLYSASSQEKEMRRLNAPSLILWEAFLEAKKEGCTTIDLWDTRPSAGFSSFKKSFGGKEINYIGAWDHAYNSVLYGAYKILKKLL